jgi:hypothetical protein
VVTIDDSGMKAPPPRGAAPPAGARATVARPSGPEVASFDRCEAAVQGKVTKLEDRQRLIFRVLIAAGVLLTIGLLFYGIKMTHRVAGPLHKVMLYMDKLRSGFYDVVYNIRKGDQLVEFYAHFKAAHGGMRGLQEADVARLRSLIAAADEARLGARSPAVAEALEELRGMLERKEKSLA